MRAPHAPALPALAGARLTSPSPPRAVHRRRLRLGHRAHRRRFGLDDLLGYSRSRVLVMTAGRPYAKLSIWPTSCRRVALPPPHRLVLGQSGQAVSVMCTAGVRQSADLGDGPASNVGYSISPPATRDPHETFAFHNTPHSLAAQLNPCQIQGNALIGAHCVIVPSAAVAVAFCGCARKNAIRRPAFGARTSWKRIRCRRGRGTASHVDMPDNRRSGV